VDLWKARKSGVGLEEYKDEIYEKGLTLEEYLEIQKSLKVEKQKLLNNLMETKKHENQSTRTKDWHQP
jgi:hypothetical protein